MPEHSPEPWSFWAPFAGEEGQGSWSIKDHNGSVLLGQAPAADPVLCIDIQDAMRISVTVNALAGIPTESLEWLAKHPAQREQFIQQLKGWLEVTIPQTNHAEKKNRQA